MNPVSLYEMNFETSSCIHCGKCEQVCPMGIDVKKNPNSPECIRCGNCVRACDVKALAGGFKFHSPKADKVS
jgi:formate hydrogenlyase subunit 6/NADH:ubiquinone oxidoreductase subunit I